ncbi:MAG: zinc metallopeptidase [Lachnospiraceae bacterium]|nr:zinc metallopeptidase [Lachnospiraceae bacterium]
MPYYYDQTYFLVLIALVITLIAQLNISATYNRYKKVPNSRGLTGGDVARMMLEQAGISDVSVEMTGGNLTDHYSPSEHVLRLSADVIGGTSVAAVGIAAHECGHAIQHKENYGPLFLRSASVPLAKAGGWIAIPLIVLGFWLELMGLVHIGIIFYSFVVAFELITLPVEFNASRRALVALENGGILSKEELKGSRKVLSAAAFTYVAALLSSLLQLLRFVALARRRR